MIKISNRLKSLTKYLFNDDIIMDVGCDHALLDIYLVQAGLAKKIYVCDVNPNALQNGINNIEKYDLVDKVIPILGFGIERANEYNINTLVISGMGSSNIIEILSGPNTALIYKLVLQSNNNHYELRKYLTSIGFNIVEEEIVPDSKKEYINIVALRDYKNTKYTEIEYEFGPILTKKKENLEYYKKLKESLEDIVLKNNSDETREKIKMLSSIIASLETN